MTLSKRWWARRKRAFAHPSRIHNTSVRAGHRGAGLGFGRSGLEVLLAPGVVGGELERVGIAMAACVETRARPVVFVQAQELGEIDLREPRRFGDLQQVLIVVVQR